MTSLETILRPGNLTTVDNEPLNHESAWYVFVESAKLLNAIDIVEKVFDRFAVDVVVQTMRDPTPKQAHLRPIAHTYAEAASIDWNRADPKLCLELPFKIEGVLVADTPRTLQMICLIDHIRNRGWMWPIAWIPNL